MEPRFVLSVLTFLLLQLVCLRALGEGSKKVFGSVGSSVLLDPECKSVLNDSDVLWELTVNGKDPVTILDYKENHHDFVPSEQFKSRLYLNNVTLSLTINNLQLADQGNYSITVNGILAKTIKLFVYEPVPEPSISSNSTYVDTAIGLDCRVTAKKLSSVLWWKDGKVITNDQRYQLTEDNRTMVIKKATKSDCGMYTCTVENAVSKKNSSHSLAIYGFPPLIHHAMELSIAALIFAAAIIFGIIVQCLHSDMQSVDFQRKDLLFLQVAAMLSFIILFAALLCWLLAEGTSAITVFMLVILSLLLILTTLSAFSMNGWVIKKFKKHLNAKCCRVTLDVVTAVGGLIVICTSSTLLWKIKYLSGKGCEPPPDLHLAISLVVLVPTVISVFTFGIFVRKYRKMKSERLSRTQSANRSQEGPAESQPSEEVIPLQAVSGGDGTSHRASANEEESS